MPSSYAIGPHFEAFIQKMIESGRFANASEVVRAGLRLLEEHERDLEERRAEFWSKIEEGMKSAREGKLIPAEEVFDELRRLLAQRQAVSDAAE